MYIYINVYIYIGGIEEGWKVFVRVFRSTDLTYVERNGSKYS